MSIHTRKLKVIEFQVGAVEYQCQIKEWKLANNTDDGEKLYAFCPDGETREEAEPDYALEIVFYADWRPDGISTFLVEHDQETAAFTLDHHPDIPAEHVRWAGSLKVKAPTVGGEARTTEMTEITLQCIGKPVYSRPDES